MSWLKKLFSGGKPGGSQEREAAPVEYKGFTIRPAPYLENGQYQTAGYIDKTVDGAVKTHRFVRADRQADFDGAVSFTTLKARQLIDEQGESLFRD